MKKLLILSIAALGVLGSGCVKWLDTERDDLMLEKEAYASEIRINSVLNGLYRTMMDNDLYGDKLSAGTVDFLAHYFDYPETESATSNKSDLRGLWQLGTYTYTDDMITTYFDPVWNKGYNLILRINTYIKNVEGSTVLAEKQREMYLGEAYGLRAMLHLDLYRLFGPVSVDGTAGVLPYHNNTAIAMFDYLAPKDFIAEVMKDLDMAEKKLETTDPIYLENKVYDAAADDDLLSSEERFATMFRNKRMNYWAVQLLKMRVYMLRTHSTDAALQNEGQTKVIEIADRFKNEAVDDTYTSYTTNPMKQKAKAFAWSPISMTVADWEANMIAYDEVIMGPSKIDNQKWWDDHFLMSSATAATRVIVKSNLMNNIFGAAAGATLKDNVRDRRKGQFVISGVEQQSVGTVADDYYHSKKFGNWMSSNTTKGTMSYNTFNMRSLLRLAEVEYMRTEVLLQKGDLPGAIATLNNVLEHRGYEPQTTVYDPTSLLPASVSPDNVRDMLTKEYYREFVYEGQAFFYLKRNGMTSIFPGYAGVTPMPGSATESRVEIKLDSYVPPRPLAERDFDRE